MPNLSQRQVLTDQDGHPAVKPMRVQNWMSLLAIPHAKVLTSYFIWPFGHFTITGSIFMTVVIGYERYRAVLRPLDHMPGERHRVLRYVALVTLGALAFNVTKFFEYEPGMGSAVKLMQS